MLNIRLYVVGFISIVLITLAGCQLRPGGGVAQTVSVVTDPHHTPPAAHGAEKIVAALEQQGIHVQRVSSLAEATGDTLLVMGTTSNSGPATEILKSTNHPLPTAAESLTVVRTRYQGKLAWVLAGADERGVMYAELDAADRISWSANDSTPFQHLREVTESPDVASRSVSLFAMNRAYWESRFYDEAYWARYLDTLAANRFNNFIVIFGYEDGGFLAPCYPYFFDTNGFPEVRMIGITPEQQAKNLHAMNRLVQMAHDRGLSFTVGIWDHIYRFNVQAGGTPGYPDTLNRPTPSLVWGMNDSNLLPYTKVALTHFLQVVPGIDAIQFRMHDESGLKVSEQEGFWRDIFALMKEKFPNIRLDLRAKGLQDSVIQNSVDTSMNFRITTKYWMEQMGLPFHPTHVNVKDQMNRRHGYADLLRYPQTYHINWQVWNGGTSRILLWGDPEFARRFMTNTHLYNGDGFEINEPLATKMEGQPHDMPPFDLLKPQYRYYDYEFERYWHLFQSFGRTAYNPETPSEVWDHEFERRFGTTAGDALEKGLHTASWILPRIVASSYPYSAFPMTEGWAEKQHFGDLPSFAKSEGSDIQIFENFDEEAKRLIEHGETAKVRPQETSLWFAQTAATVNAHIAEAQKHIGKNRGKEFDSTIVDLKILADLADYHAARIPAAVSYRIYFRTKDTVSLDAAIAGENNAIVAWRKLVADAGDVYADDLMFGARSRNLCGNWREELTSLENGLKTLNVERSGIATAATHPAPLFTIPAALPVRPTIAHDPVLTAPAGKPISISADIHAPSGIKWVHLRYRSVNQYKDYQTLTMFPTGPHGEFQATVPADQIPPEFDFMYLIEIMDNNGNGFIYPDVNSTTPYIVAHLAR